MRLAFIVLFLALAVLAALYFTGIIQTTPSTINISTGNINIAAAYSSFVIVTGWVVGILFSITGLIATGFRNKVFLFLFLLLVIAGSFIFYYYIYK